MQTKRSDISCLQNNFKPFSGLLKQLLTLTTQSPVIICSRANSDKKGHEYLFFDKKYNMITIFIQVNHMIKQHIVIVIIHCSRKY